MAKTKKKKNWIQEAIRNPGAFTAYCKRKGYDGVTEACIHEGLTSPNPTIRRRARFARKLRKLAKSK